MITRREFGLGLGLAASIGRAAAKRPNIVIFLADDLGWRDIGCYGASDVKTPHIDGMARRGVRFSQYYCNAPECTPSRAALLTGRYQQRVGGLECAIGVGNVGRYDEAEWLEKRGELGLPATEWTFSRALRNSGYRTACFGKWHLGYPRKFHPSVHGFEEYVSILGGNANYFTHREEDGTLVLNRNGKPLVRKGYVTDIFAEESIAWLKRRRGQPFFLYLPFTAPHVPLQDPAAYDPKTGTAPVVTQDRRVYCRMVERMDARIGDVLSQIRAMGAEENTIAIFMSDNGGEANGDNGELRGRKGSVWEGGLRVPCIAQWPGKFRPGSSTSQLTMTMDFAPTLLRAAGVEPPGNLDGIDIAPFATGEREPQPRTVFWRFKRSTNVRKAAREGDLKLVSDNGQEELHDLASDPREEKNLLASRLADAQRLRERLAAWERDVAAPRLRDFPRT
jgi:N-acetylgalactosamine-6-sulfatase